MVDVKRPANSNVCRDVDSAVGQQIERALKLRNLTLAQLSERASIPLEDLQACCAGLNRLPAKALCDIASVLRLPVSYFFDPLLRVVQ